MQSIGAIGVMILAIIGLAGVLTNVLAAVATIVIGAVILMEGGLVGAAYRRLRYAAVTESQTQELGGGVTAEFFGGAAGIVLGILALFEPVPATLLAAALLVFGATLLLGTAASWRWNWQARLETPVENSTSAVYMTSSGGHLLIGLGTVVLGILAVAGMVPMTLILVGLLCLGAGALFSSPV